MQLTRILSASRRIPGDYHNMPRRTVERHTTFLIKRAPNLPQYRQKIFKYQTAKGAYYDEWRPWQDEFKRLNTRGVYIRKIFVEPIREWSFFRGDRVEVLRGPEKGMQGIINYIVRERNWVFVQGLNLKRTLNLGSDKKLGLGTITCKEDPFLVNLDVKLVDPADLLPTECEWRYDDEGTRVRVSKRTGRLIPIPEQAYETIDYVTAKGYRLQPKDTPESEVKKVTFQPEAKTFEMDICDKMGIKDDRVPYPMYWY